jgi:Neutral/alkaline non-lysosomal ceramidase, N-terminal
MNLGISQIDITPEPGVELSGFAARIQPSIGVLDPLFAKALHLVCDGTELLWLHCDLIGFDRMIVQRFRDWARREFGLKDNQVLLSATHTHAGPCTIHLREAGEFDAAYVEFLLAQMRECARQAVARKEKCQLAVVESKLDLAVDRRKTASSHTDPRAVALGFRRADGSFAAAVVNYAIHPVALGSNNRLIGADISGQAALALAKQLPGNPVVLITNGACANLNPPAKNVSPAQVQQWGGQIASAVGDLLLASKPKDVTKSNLLRSVVPLPLEVLDADGINRFASRALQNSEALAQWGDKYRRVVEYWRETLLRDGYANGNGHHDAELFGVRLNDVILVGANAEVFSDFTDMLRRNCGKRICLIGYANGDIGYVPTRAAYAEGGYEVEEAHMFYGGFRLLPGGLERLAAAATDLVNELEGATSSETKATRPPLFSVEPQSSARNV